MILEQKHHSDLTSFCEQYELLCTLAWSSHFVSFMYYFSVLSLYSFCFALIQSAGRSTTVHWTAWHVLHRWIWNTYKNGIYYYFIAYVPAIWAYHKYPLCVLFVKRESKGHLSSPLMQTSAHSSGGWWIQFRCVVLLNPGISPVKVPALCAASFSNCAKLHGTHSYYGFHGYQQKRCSGA